MMLQMFLSRANSSSPFDVSSTSVDSYQDMQIKIANGPNCLV